MTAAHALVVVAAYEPELAPLRARLAQAGLGGVPCRAVGIGIAAAAAGCARMLGELRPASVLLTGSGGLYPGAGAFTPGEVVVGVSLRLLDAACLEGHAALPAPIRSELATDARGRDALLRAGAQRAVAIGTTVGITTDDALAARLAQYGACAVETLEAQGVAQACHDAGVPLSVVLGVTNRVGAAGRTEWLDHRAQAAEACAEVIARFVASTRGA